MIKSYTVKEFAKRKGVSEETVRRWCRNGKFKDAAVRLSKKEGWRIVYDFHEESRYFNELNKNGCTLKSAIIDNEHIHGGARVYDALHSAGIDNWKDAVALYRNGYLPNYAIKGIGNTTWPILIEMIAEEELYRFPYGRRALELAIDKACPGQFVSERNVKAKILPALRRIHIRTLEELWGAPEDYISDNRNIGPLMLSDILKIREDVVGSHVEHYKTFIDHFNYCSLFKAELIEKTLHWQRMANEQKRD